MWLAKLTCMSRPVKVDFYDILCFEGRLVLRFILSPESQSRLETRLKKGTRVFESFMSSVGIERIKF